MNWNDHKKNPNNKLSQLRGLTTFLVVGSNGGSCHMLLAYLHRGLGTSLCEPPANIKIALFSDMIERYLEHHFGGFHLPAKEPFHKRRKCFVPVL